MDYTKAFNERGYDLNNLLVSFKNRYPQETWTQISDRIEKTTGVKTNPGAIAFRYKYLIESKPVDMVKIKKTNRGSTWYGDLKVGYLDIETTGFSADYDFMLSWVIKNRGGKAIHDNINSNDLISGKFDKRIVASLVEAMKKFDVIVTYYGTGFDIVFIRTRAIKYGLDFPKHGDISHIDMYYTVKNRLKLSKNSLAAACAFFDIYGKTHLSSKKWLLARYGNKEALNYVLSHNIADTVILEKLHRKLEDFSNFNRRSI